MKKDVLQDPQDGFEEWMAESGLRGEGVKVHRVDPEAVKAFEAYAAQLVAKYGKPEDVPGILSVLEERATEEERRELKRLVWRTQGFFMTADGSLSEIDPDAE